MDIIYMTYCPDNANESATGRRSEIEITPEMIEAGTKEVIFDSESPRSAIVWDLVTAVLEAGGYDVVEA